MQILDLVQYIKRSTSISKMLIFNDLQITKNEIIELSRLVQDVYIAFFNRFSTRNLFVQLRMYKNIHIVQPSDIPNLSYDFFVVYELDRVSSVILSRIKSLKYFYIANSGITYQKNILNFVQLDEVKNLYKRDQTRVEVAPEKVSQDSFQTDLKMNTIFATNKKAEEKPDIKQIDAKCVEELLTVRNPNLINLKNIVATKNKFKFFKEQSTHVEGQLDICCFLSTKNDFNTFLEVVQYINKNYFNTKYFIFLSGKTILKYFKEDSYSQLNAIILKSKNANDFSEYKDLFNLLSNGSHKIFMDQMDLSKEIFELL